ncbi:DNA polymerase III, beta subunit [Candidatus Ruthia magnifica str. Cm (Calyptogena magnifica)]|uniref:Beta sliding clamp n=1 Tax=Ruthia magnifica subsp. Calyptogena magnifica TaxID=413404 RepID=A1AV49_RUTMC|nr:DNA polymerase III subunit beta [Candidatus Ruthturnera calyptogenae]ABL01806.1 DNA polymerase III, beta subunit [Candidatus Ruthia magnifica str. Cm (Calyptogena magnifica)]
MNIQLTVKELLTPLQIVISVVEKKQKLPILSHVLIQLKDNLLTLTTTDMEIEIRASQIIKNQEEISFTIYAKDLIDIIKKLSEDIIIEFIIESSKIYIKVNKNSFELNTSNHQDFPSLPKIKNSDIIKIKRHVLKDLIENTSFSMGSQDIRTYLNGLYLEIDKNSIVVVATDGHRLSIGKVKQTHNLSNKKSVILPRKAVFELTKLLNKNGYKEIDIHLSDNYFYLISNNTTIISRLIDGNFPNYLQVLPTNFNNIIIINRLAFLNSLQQASIFVEERTKGVKLVFKNSKLHIFSHSERGQAKTQINIKNFDKEIEIAFNINYLISILEKLHTNEINMIVPDGKSQSCLLSSMNDDIYQYVVMPMRI